MLSRCLLPVVLIASIAFSQNSWLEFNAGAPDSTAPLVQFNGKWDSFLTFDVELRGLLAETVTVDSQDYLRFTQSPGTVPSDSTGWPELPVVRRMVWLPDDSDITLEYSADCCQGIECLPVYPAPLDSLIQDSTCTPYIGDYFRLDSAAYASEEWYPDTLARLVGEFRLGDLRVGIVEVCPVQYLASEDSLRVWSDIEVGLSWDEQNAVWSQAGLGHYDNLIGDNLLGYTPEPQPLNDGTGSVVRVYANRLVSGPGYAPDYVILVAAGLDGQAVTDLAEHRADLNGFDVAIVRTDDVLECYGGQETVLTADMIRDFTEDMWDWGTGPGDRPTYLLLIGDHEDPSYGSEDWFLPTRTTDPDAYGNRMGSDGWFGGFDDPRGSFNAFPDMIVGRLPARTTAELGSMVDLIVDFESEVNSWPPPAGLGWRRWLTRLAGTNNIDEELYSHDPWNPGPAWTQQFAGWLGYSLDNYYCGDGERANSHDGSDITSAEWVSDLRSVFSRGSQVALYTDHGSGHLFSAGLNWEEGGPPNLGIPDSTFDDLDVEGLPYNVSHGWPFVLMLCCSAGTFNETQAEHDYVSEDPPELSCWDFALRPPPGYDFGTDCLAEEFMLNTTGGAIGVLASSLESCIYCYRVYGCGIMDAIYEHGLSRTGDAIQACRLEDICNFGAPGGWYNTLGQFNLLGDPAVDIGDRVKFRSRCDLVVVPDELSISRYPTMLPGESTGDADLSCIVHNWGAVASSPCTASMEITCGNYSTTLTAACASIPPGGSRLVRFDWHVPSQLVPPFTLALHATADTQGVCSDSWTANNDASADAEILDFYPNEEGWPAKAPGCVQSPPCLADIDGDGDLEIIVLAGTSWLQAFEPDGELDWSVETPSVMNMNCVPEVFAAGNVCGIAAPEIVVDCYGELCVFDAADGDLLYAFEHDAPGLCWQEPHDVVLADMIAETPPEGSRDEIAFICSSTLYLLRVQNGELDEIASAEAPSGMGYSTQAWISAGELDGSAPQELVVTMTDVVSQKSLIGLFGYRNGGWRYYSTCLWNGECSKALPALGNLAGQGMRIAISRRRSIATHIPAYIMNPTDLQGTPVSCQPTSTPSSNILCCMMTDWRSDITGLDRVIAPAENQCMVWDEDGFGDWNSVYSTPDSYRPPFGALGDLDGDENPDLLVGTRSGVVMAYDKAGDPLEGLGFPYVLPAEVCGGYCVADIDNDGKIEVVFGTMDGYVHVWELGECDEGYAPWPQVQHDAARTGVLE